MAHQYHCGSERRRRLVAAHATLNGIDYLEVLDRDAAALGSPRQQTLLVRCLKPVPAGLTAANVAIAGGVRVTAIAVAWVGIAAEAAALESAGLIGAAERAYLEGLDEEGLDEEGLDEPDHVLVVRTGAAGDFSPYRLALVSDEAPLAGFDPLLSEVAFSFKVECPSDFDCATRPVCPPAAGATPPIDYLARDYESIRRLLLDRLAVVAPDWTDRSPADLGIAVVEVLAHVADQLSYEQDAAATEAYLDTARRRASVRRHARLLDYTLHDGCNARAWVAVTVKDGVANQRLERVPESTGEVTRFLSRVPGEGTIVAAEDLAGLVALHAPAVFEPMHDLPLFAAHNTIRFYTWGDRECCLPRGATRATLVDDAAARLMLRAGAVLVFTEVLSPATGQAADADPAHRQAVRLVRVEPEATVSADGTRSPGALRQDELVGQPIVEIEWAGADALAFPLCLSFVREQDGVDVLYEDASVARGNIVLCDHGRTTTGAALDPPTGDRWYRPRLAESPVAHGTPLAVEPPAAAGLLVQDSRQALPLMRLDGDPGEDWRPRRDLLASDRFDAHFVLETETNDRPSLRFGDDTFGRRPAAQVVLTPTYRVGNGAAGNVGAGALAHVITADDLEITAVTNLLPAQGGADPESPAEARQYAPQAFRRQERAVTAADYAEMAGRPREVSRAVARRRWTGSWHTMFVTVDRQGGRPVDAAFEAELAAFLDRYRLAGHDVEIAPPVFVPLDVALRICVAPGHRRSDVTQELLAVFGSRDLPDGRRGFFHPDRWTFSDSVYLSEVVALAMSVPGVRWVDLDETADPPARFQRWGEKARGEIAAGRITLGRFEVVQLDNDPNRPENGRFAVHLEGGL